MAVPLLTEGGKWKRGGWGNELTESTRRSGNTGWKKKGPAVGEMPVEKHEQKQKSSGRGEIVSPRKWKRTTELRGEQLKKTSLGTGPG